MTGDSSLIGLWKSSPQERQNRRVVCNLLLYCSYGWPLRWREKCGLELFVVEFEALIGRSMQPTVLAAFFEFSRTAFSMSAAVLALLVIGLLAAKNDIVQARGLDKIAALTNLCFAIRWRPSAQNIFPVQNS